GTARRSHESAEGRTALDRESSTLRVLRSGAAIWAAAQPLIEASSTGTLTRSFAQHAGAADRSGTALGSASMGRRGGRRGRCREKDDPNDRRGWLQVD